MPALFVSYSPLLGGAERILVDMAVGLDEPAIVACPEGPLALHARDAGLRTFAMRERSLELRASARDRLLAPVRLAGHAREVHELVTSLRPELVCGWGMRAGMACASALAPLQPRPALLFQHNDVLPGPTIARFVRGAARRADRVSCLSETIAADLDPARELGARLRVVRPGIDLERFAPVPPPDGPPTALLLGALVGWKRPDLALEATALAAREVPELRLVVAGAAIDSEGARLEQRLRHRAQRPDLAGRVEFTGELADPRDALRNATCLLHCADCEPYGLVLLEALASSRPVVVPRSGGPAEIFEEGCGRLFRPGDAEEAASALVDVVGRRGHARELGAAGRAEAERRFDVDDARRRFRELAADARAAHRALAGAVNGRSRGNGRRRAARAGAGMALVTVTHDSRVELEAMLASVSVHLPGAQVVVVDSGSTDGSAEAARAWEGSARVLELGENVGFAAASNEGLISVDAPVTVLLNPDTELLDGSLAALGRELSRPGAPERLLAPLVLLPDGRRQDSVHSAPASSQAVVSALVPSAAIPRPVRSLVEPWRSNRPRRVSWAVGCCLAARTETLRRLGPFDDRIFLYAEDLDLGLRATDAGIETWFWPEARVLHHRAHATAKAFGGEPFELLARQRRFAVWERRGAKLARRDDWTQLATFANRIAVKSLLGRSSLRERRQLQALRTARRTRPLY